MKAAGDSLSTSKRGRINFLFKTSRIRKPIGETLVDKKSSKDGSMASKDLPSVLHLRKALFVTLWYRSPYATSQSVEELLVSSNQLLFTDPLDERERF